MRVDKKKIGELEKALLQSPKMALQTKAFLKRFLAEAKKNGEEYYLDTLECCVNAAVGSQGTINGLTNKVSNNANTIINSQGSIEGLRRKKKVSVKRAIPPQGGIKGNR